MSDRVRVTQSRLNRFFREEKLSYRPLRVDGKLGPTTRKRIKLARYFLGVGPGNVGGQSAKVTDVLLHALLRPKKRLKGETVRENLRRRRTASKRKARRRKAVKASRSKRTKGTSLGSPHWGGSRYCVERTRFIAAKHGHPVTSTKRWPPVNGNFGSWHNTSILDAWADDYGTFNGAQHAQEIRSFWGNHREASGTYETYLVQFEGRVYVKQTLWAVLGHFNHVHDGARA